MVKYRSPIQNFTTLHTESKSRSRGACPPGRIWGQQKQQKPCNQWIQANNEYGQIYNTDYQYFIENSEIYHSSSGYYKKCETL